MSFGSYLASQAKHIPEDLEPDDVRRAGRIIEVYEELLGCLTSLECDEYGNVTLTFTVNKDLSDSVMYHKYADE